MFVLEKPPVIYTVYALHSPKYDKIYIGFSSNLYQRLLSHNRKGKKGWTIKYRPWKLIYTESYLSKPEAKMREKQLKTARGRKFIRSLIE
ncbi:MAG: GIY-YIG nuclease family protein [Fidelibacterota bacterium]